MNIVLCGMPGSGKTTVAEKLKNLSGMHAVDTDAIIVEKYGKISDIFANFGEEKFRQIETEVCKDLSQSKNLVIATGGGCVLRQQNVKYLKLQGKIVYLKAKEETLLKRLEGDTARPLLAGNLKEKLSALFSARSSVYQSVADIVVETDLLNPEEVAKRILQLIKN